MFKLAQDGNIPELIKYRDNPAVNDPQLLSILQKAIHSRPLQSFNDAIEYYYTSIFNRMTTNNIIWNGMISGDIIGYRSMVEVLEYRMSTLDNMLNINLLLELLSVCSQKVFDNVYPMTINLLTNGGDDKPLLIDLFKEKIDVIDHVLDITPSNEITDSIVYDSIIYLKDMDNYYYIIETLVNLAISITDDTLLKLIQDSETIKLVDVALTKYRKEMYSNATDLILSTLSGVQYNKFIFLLNGGSTSDLYLFDDDGIMNMDIDDTVQ